MSNTECALWYWRYKAPHYMVCKSEEDAASLAYDLEDQGDGIPEAVQFPDGRIVSLGDWPAYALEIKERARIRSEMDLVVPDDSYRVIRSAIGTNPLQVSVPESTPSWVGLANEG